jgi:hypothetical protein
MVDMEFEQKTLVKAVDQVSASSAAGSIDDATSFADAKSLIIHVTPSSGCQRPISALTVARKLFISGTLRGVRNKPS